MEHIKEDVIKKIISDLIHSGLDREQIDIVHRTLIMNLADYDISKTTTEIVVYRGDINERLLKKFLIVKRVAGRTEKTLNAYRNGIRAALQKMQKSCLDITTDDIRVYLAKRETYDGISKAVLDTERRYLSTFYNWLNEEGIVTVNPVKRVEKIKVPKKKKKSFTEFEVEKIRSAARTAREKAIVELLFSTGCRVSELIGIKSEDIKEDRIVVMGKGQKERIVYMNARAKLAVGEYLKERKDSNPYLFPKGINLTKMQKQRGLKPSEMPEWYKYPELIAEGQQDAASIEKLCRNLGKRADVDNVHPHRFRRTCATLALRRGMSVIHVSKILGHEQLDTTKIYLDIDEKEVQMAHEKFVL